MALPNAIINLLELLAESYKRELSYPQIHVYVHQLRHIPYPNLRDAVLEWINKSPFFPKVCELRDLAGSYPPPQPDEMVREYQRLVQKFHEQGVLDEQEWEDLASSFEICDRLERAGMVREKMEELRGDVVEEEDWLADGI